MTGISQIENIKGSVVPEESLLRPRSSYITFCQACSWYGYLHEKIIREFEGIRCEEEDGYIDIFAEYDYDTETAEKGTKHIDAFEELKKQEKFHMTVSRNQERTNTIKWIEKGILEHSLSDHRKYIIWRILSPYLLNVRKLPKEEAYSIMKDWLDKCDKLEYLSFNQKIKIKDGLKGASKGYLPISMEKLKEENRQLYDVILNSVGKDK